MQEVQQDAVPFHWQSSLRKYTVHGLQCSVMFLEIGVTGQVQAGGRGHADACYGVHLEKADTVEVVIPNFVAAWVVDCVGEGGLRSGRQRWGLAPLASS